MNINIIHKVSAGAFFAAALLAPILAPADEGPLCPTPHQMDTIKELKRTSPGLTPAQIALQTRLPEAAVVHAMPLDSRIAVAKRDFQSLWNSIRRWDSIRLTAVTAGSEFAIHGRLPHGENGVGYFEFQSDDGVFQGRLKRDRIGAIYLLSTPGEYGRSHQVVFFDNRGDRVFAIFVPRDPDGRLLKQPYREFLQLKNEYSGRSFICD